MPIEGSPSEGSSVETERKLVRITVRVVRSYGAEPTEYDAGWLDGEWRGDVFHVAREEFNDIVSQSFFRELCAHLKLQDWEQILKRDMPEAHSFRLHLTIDFGEDSNRWPAIHFSSPYARENKMVGRGMMVRENFPAPFSPLHIQSAELSKYPETEGRSRTYQMENLTIVVNPEQINPQNRVA